MCKIKWLRLVMFSLGLPFLSSDAQGTSFTAVPLEAQVRNAEGVIWGKFTGSASKRIAGEVVTEASFELLAVSGVAPSEIVNKKNFKVVYPGGTWQGITYKILGTPRFKRGEEVVLFIIKGRYGFQLVNLGLSKYRVERNIRDNKKQISFSNSIFNEHPELGNISLETLE